jgi:hypothetical protein
MKKSLSIFFLFTLLFSACEKCTNYSAQIAQERKKIKQYIANEKINVIYNFSNGVKKDSVCNYVMPEKNFYSLGEDSIYFRVMSVGKKNSELKLYDRLEIRYIEYTLDNPPFKESYWNTQDLPYPIELIFGDNSTATNRNCKGWQQAIKMMRYSECIAEIIVPSKLGLNKNYISVTPCRYQFTFKILPK